MAVACAHLMGSGFVPRKLHTFACAAVGVGGLKSVPALICPCLSLRCQLEAQKPRLISLLMEHSLSLS